MKKLLIMSVFNLFIMQTQLLASNDYQQSQCYQKYETKSKKAHDRYKRAMNNTINFRLSSNAFYQAVGENMAIPKWSDYEYYGEPILKAADANLAFSSFHYPLLDKIKTKLAKKQGQYSYEQIQQVIRFGFSSGDFCSPIIGEKGEDRVTRFVVDHFKKSSSDVIEGGVSVSNQEETKSVIEDSSNVIIPKAIGQ